MVVVCLFSCVLMAWVYDGHKCGLGFGGNVPWCALFPRFRVGCGFLFLCVFFHELLGWVLVIPFFKLGCECVMACIVSLVSEGTI